MRGGEQRGAGVEAGAGAAGSGPARPGKADNGRPDGPAVAERAGGGANDAGRGAADWIGISDPRFRERVQCTGGIRDRSPIDVSAAADRGTLSAQHAATLLSRADREAGGDAGGAERFGWVPAADAGQLGSECNGGGGRTAESAGAQDEHPNGRGGTWFLRDAGRAVAAGPSVYSRG